LRSVSGSSQAAWDAAATGGTLLNRADVDWVARSRETRGILQPEVHTMASYEFECHACSERFQVNVPMSEHDGLKLHPPACPKCASHDTHRLVSLFSSKPASSY
jgi:putative FmdB family regulatory protein